VRAEQSLEEITSWSRNAAPAEGDGDWSATVSIASWNSDLRLQAGRLRSSLPRPESQTWTTPSIIRTLSLLSDLK